MKVKLREIKRQWTRNGMRQVIESPHKTFNKQTNLIDNNGNMIASTQCSKYIRAYNDTECNGFSFAKGHLQNVDIKHLSTTAKLYIQEQNKDTTFWVTEFYLKDIFCIMILNLDTMELKVFDYSKNYKQSQLVEWLTNYLFEWGE